MIYGQDYFGFVYLWYDRKKKLFCIGSTKQSLEHRYKSGTGYFSLAYKKRPQDFKRRVLFYDTIGDRDRLFEEEQRWLNMIKDEELCNNANKRSGTHRYYNMKKRASGGNGGAHKGKKFDDEWRANIRKASRGRQVSDETKAKMSAAQLGKKLSDEHRQKLSESKKGRPISEQQKQYLSEFWKNKPKPPRTREHCENIRLAQLGKPKVKNACCEHCGMVLTKAMYVRHHGPKCKNKWLTPPDPEYSLE